jgi:hypothetical protein
MYQHLSRKPNPLPNWADLINKLTYITNFLHGQYNGGLVFVELIVRLKQ